MNRTHTHFALSIAALTLVAGPSGAQTQAASQAESYVELYATVDAAVNAARAALEQKRLKDAQVTKTTDGFNV
ncbi:MAG: hypothetical protein JWP59_2896, partial [Massilia sp.]|nr:hypothetical protein [Massilia sp.]